MKTPNEPVEEKGFFFLAGVCDQSSGKHFCRQEIRDSNR
jgi:hypothetical protein